MRAFSAAGSSAIRRIARDLGEGETAEEFGSRFRRAAVYGSEPLDNDVDLSRSGPGVAPAFLVKGRDLELTAAPMGASLAA
jgi:hypothetical protein